ncbi:MAG: hypothetical protein PF904_10935 [Kiritimatiellae bacterium]|jgi:hypothetical protein|nr:hypothetical protein [Kiritimatiellia bacterium]
MKTSLNILTILTVTVLCIIAQTGCISQSLTLNLPASPEASEAPAAVTATSIGSNHVYRATGGLVITMGIYSNKDIAPDTDATIPLQ